MDRRTFGAALLYTPLLASFGPVLACTLKPNSTGAPEVQQDTAPLFALEDENAKTVALGEVLTRGPAVLCFYRGFW